MSESHPSRWRDIASLIRSCTNRLRPSRLNSRDLPEAPALKARACRLFLARVRICTSLCR